MQDKVQILKVIGAGAVILAAVAIMLPGIMDYLTSLSRLVIYVGLAIALAVSIGIVIRRFQKPDHENKKS